MFASEISAKKITLPKKTAIGEIIAANVIPPLLAPQPIRDGPDRDQATAKKRKVQVRKNFGTYQFNGVQGLEFRGTQ